MSEQALIAELQSVNARLVALLASKSTAEPEQLPGIANEYAENMELVHIYRTQGIEAWKVAHKECMARRKASMAAMARRLAQ